MQSLDGRWSSRVGGWARSWGLLTLSGLETALIAWLVVHALRRRHDAQVSHFQTKLLLEIGDTVTACDLDGRITFANEAAARLAGQHRDDLVGQPVEVYGVRFKKGFKPRQILDASLTKGHWEGELVVAEPDGSESFLLCRAWAVRGRSGRPVGACAIGIDVTQRRLADERIRASERRLRTILATAGEGFWELDNQARTVDANPELCSILGRSRHELLGHKLSEFLDPADVETFEQQWQMRRHGHAGRYELTFLRPDRTAVHCMVRSTPLRNEQGRELGAFKVVSDITEHKQAEEALRASQEMLSVAFRSVPAAITITELEDGRIIDVNDGFSQLSGYTREEVLGYTTLEMQLWADPEKRAALIDVLRRHGSVRDLECVFRHKSGRLFHALVSGELVSLRGRPCLLAVITDITERLRAEQELRETQEALLERQRRERHLVEAELAKAREELIQKTRLAALGQLTATVSHEIRNPLGTIRTSIHAVSKAVRDRGLGVERPLERIERSIVRCDRIIEEMLDYARERKLKRVPTQFDAWLADVLDEQTVPEGVTLVRRLNTGITADIGRDALRRCIINLHDNACQAMLSVPGGEKRLLVATEVAGPHLLIRVQDSGPGIPADVLNRVFEPLFSTKSFGVGLGLPIVKQIMEQHDGGVDVQCEPGRGTTVTLWFPPRATDAPPALVSVAGDQRSHVTQGTKHESPGCEGVDVRSGVAGTLKTS